MEIKFWYPKPMASSGSRRGAWLAVWLSTLVTSYWTAAGWFRPSMGRSLVESSIEGSVTPG